MKRYGPVPTDLSLHDRSFLLGKAVRNGGPEIVVEVLKLGADPSTALHLAARHGRLVEAQLVIDAGADINAPGKHSGDSILYSALSESENRGMIGLLLNNGPKIDGFNSRGEMPIIHAVQWWGVESVQLLIDRGINIHIGGPNRSVLGAAINRARPFNWDSLPWSIVDELGYCQTTPVKRRNIGRGTG